MNATETATQLPVNIRKLQARCPELTVAIRARLAGRGGRGSWFLATPAELAEKGPRLIAACRLVVGTESVVILEIRKGA